MRILLGGEILLLSMISLAVIFFLKELYELYLDRRRDKFIEKTIRDWELQIHMDKAYVAEDEATRSKRAFNQDFGNYANDLWAEGLKKKKVLGAKKKLVKKVKKVKKRA